MFLKRSERLEARGRNPELRFRIFQYSLLTDHYTLNLISKTCTEMTQPDKDSVKTGNEVNLAYF
ncbi:hypothetical protein A33Q_1211 [Indibacter alkaliphilus LW1]|jgi:hypothetical protein|uniref:Uncharacterized protein n=1 Tax=Indibacter alkaliphilus (strain CCUG 57479 / KCTC 22604 / LW1) TaxID=1189612 RepID=S2DHS7_INDAL|nr:hypothetical protein A33Q_1211 [Indibacter alkaliphilus LW1]